MICVLELFIFVLMISCSSNVKRARKQVDLSGKWSGFESEWGWVTIQGDRGTYTDTHESPGKFTFERIGDNKYSGTWGESDKRHGTMSFAVSEDGKKIFGTYTADEDCEIAPGSKGVILWIRERNPHVYNVDYSFEMVPDPNKIDRAKDLKLWIPMPREWDSQKNVKIISVQPEPHARYVDPEHGNPMLFWDFGKMPEQAVYKVDIAFSLESYEVNVEVDPKRVGSYDKTSKEYALYTRSTHTISITPKIREMAREAIGDEKNPYLQAKRIFEFVGKKVRYKLTFERGVQYLLDNPIKDDQGKEEYYVGDCGQFSALFITLCRGVGIPARSVNGYVGWRPWAKAEDLKQFHAYETMLSPAGLAGARHCVALPPHSWAEFYIPGFGWVPVDATNGVFGYRDNRKLIMSKACDVMIGSYAIEDEDGGYGYQWVPIKDGRVDYLQAAVWNIAKIRTSKLTILHHDPYGALPAVR